MAWVRIVQKMTMVEISTHTRCHSMGLSIMLIFSVEMVYIELSCHGCRNDTQYVSRF